MRTGVILSDEEKEFVKNLNHALDKMSTYEGSLQRSLYFKDNDVVIEFLQDYEIGKPITYNEFLSTTRGEEYNPDGQVQIFIQNETYIAFTSFSPIVSLLSIFSSPAPVDGIPL